jgi:hypothetical protein
MPTGAGADKQPVTLEELLTRQGWAKVALIRVTIDRRKLSGNRRLLGRPRLREIKPSAPSLATEAHSLWTLPDSKIHDLHANVTPLDRVILDVQRRPVAASPSRGHQRGHLQKQKGKIFCEDRYLDREFGGQPSHL